MKYLLILSTIFLSSYALGSEMEYLDASEFSPSFTNRFSVQADINPNLRQLTSISNFNFDYAAKHSVYWLDFNFQISSGTFDKMTINNQSATLLTNAGLFNERATHTSLGVGAMLISHYARSLFSMNDLYETTSAYLTYNMFKTPSVANTFTEPGMMAKYSLCKKYSDFFSVGANLNYVLSSVKRAELVMTETSSSKSLTLSYVTMGIDFIFTL